MRTFMIFFIFLYVLVSDFKQTNRIQDLEYKIEKLQHQYNAIDNDLIKFENMHADHYAFEEEGILKYLEPDKAFEYKFYLDSIKSK